MKQDHLLLITLFWTNLSRISFFKYFNLPSVAKSLNCCKEVALNKPGKSFKIWYAFKKSSILFVS